MVCIIVVRDRCAVDPGVTGGSDRNHAAVAEVKASARTQRSATPAGAALLDRPATLLSSCPVQQ
jgi:hypothetical protein